MSQVKLLIDHDGEGASFTRGPGCPPEWRSDKSVEQLRKMLRDAIADAEAWIDELERRPSEIFKASRDPQRHPRDEDGRFIKPPIAEEPDLAEE